MPPKPDVKTAFLSVKPLEPVLVFANGDEAAYFQSHCKQGRILLGSSKWVYMPLPEGLLRVRTARNGDVSFDFDSHRHAEDWNQSLKGLGIIYGNTKDNPTWDRCVYLGKSLN